MSLGAKRRAIDEDRIGKAVDPLHKEGENFILLAGSQLLLINNMDMSDLEFAYELSEGLIKEL